MPSRNGASPSSKGRTSNSPEIVLWQSDEIAAASQALELIETLGWFLPLLALILIGLAIWVSADRRRTISALGFGSAIAFLVTLVLIDVTKANTVGAIEDDIARPAAVEIWETTVRFFVQASWALIVLGLIVGFVAWVFGPSERAQRVRTWWNETIERWRGDDATVPTSGFAGFIATWKRTIQWGAVVLGLLFIILVPDASAWAVIITALVVLVIVAVVEVVGGPNAPPQAPTDTTAIKADRTPAADVDLTAVKGIGTAHAEQLNEAGIHTLAQLAAADPVVVADATDTSESAAESWIEQAAALSRPIAPANSATGDV